MARTSFRLSRPFVFHSHLILSTIFFCFSCVRQFWTIIHGSWAYVTTQHVLISSLSSSCLRLLPRLLRQSAADSIRRDYHQMKHLQPAATLRGRMTSAKADHLSTTMGLRRPRWTNDATWHASPAHRPWKRSPGLSGTSALTKTTARVKRALFRCVLSLNPGGSMRAFASATIRRVGVLTCFLAACFAHRCT